MRRLGLVMCVSVGVLVAGCAKPRARVEAPLPELVPPPPPPRVVATYEADIEPPPAAPEPVDAVQPPRPKPRPRGTPETDTVSKPEQPQPPPAESARAPQTLSLTLKPVPGTEAQSAASIRTLLGTTSRNLARVDVSSLDRDGRTQYDTTRSLMQQAEEALKSGNLVFAEKLADKAASMSAQLVR